MNKYKDKLAKARSKQEWAYTSNTSKNANTKISMQMSKYGLSAEQVWMWPPTQLHFAVTSDSARWDNVRLMGQKQDKYLLFCSGCLPSKSLHYVTSLLICGEKKTCHQWWTGFCTDVDHEKATPWMILDYNMLQYSHFVCTKLNLIVFVSLWGILVEPKIWLFCQVLVHLTFLRS